MLEEVDAILHQKGKRLLKKSTINVDKPGLHRANQFDFERETEDVLDTGRVLDALPKINQWEKDARVDDAIRRREMTTHIEAAFASEPFESMQTVDNLFQDNLNQTADVKADRAIKARVKAFVKAGEIPRGFTSICAEQKVTDARMAERQELLGSGTPETNHRKAEEK